MRRRRIVALVAAGAVLAIGSVIAIQLRPERVCGCSVAPAILGAGGPAASRFADLVRAGDRAGAWAMLTDDARRRYGDPDRFEPVRRELAAGYAAFAPESEWSLLERHTLAGMVARPIGTPPASAAFVVVEPVVGGWRVDPRPSPLSVSVAPGDPDQIRVDAAGAGPEPPDWTVTVYDAAGAATGPAPDGEPGRYRLARTADPVLVVVTGTDGSTWWAGSAIFRDPGPPSTSSPR